MKGLRRNEDAMKYKSRYHKTFSFCYTYDANGNIITDGNKNFTATYNHLDKPERIIMENNPNKDIRYVYDATGERLQKIVRHNDTVRTTTYVDGLTYLNDTTLLFFTHDGGRTRRNYKGRLVNDYFIEDHLGNTRMVLTDERDTVAYLAAFETNRDALENAVWRNRNATKETIVSNNAFFNNPNPNSQYSRLNGSDANRRKGPGLVLKVMAGDTLNITTRALYYATSVPHTMATVNDMVTSVLTGFLGAASGNALLDNKAWLQTNNGVVINTNALNSFITGNQNNNSHNQTPRAYLKYLLFDEDFNLVQGFAERIDDGAGTVHTYNAGGQLVVPKNGFIYVFTTNESPVDVWFDDINVIHRTGPLLQESSFYPFGMEITPLSSYAAIKVPNERDYQKNELDEEFGLELHYFDARMYDAQVGRFGGVDPKADKQLSLTPYHQSANNPVMFVDPDGRLFFAAAIIAGKVLAKKLIAKKAMVGIAKLLTKKSVKIGVSAARNVMSNWNKIYDKKSGSIKWGNMFAYAAVGAAGGAVGVSKLDAGISALGQDALAFGTGGFLNMVADGATGQEYYGFWDGFSSFVTGGTSALAGSKLGASMKKGATEGFLDSDITGFPYTTAMKKKSYVINSVLGGFDNVSNMNALYQKDGKDMSFGQGMLAFITGAGFSAATEWAGKGIAKLKMGDIGQYLAVGVTNFAGNYLQNVTNYGFKNDGSFKWDGTGVLRDKWFKMAFKADVNGAGAFFGYNDAKGVARWLDYFGF